MNTLKLIQIIIITTIFCSCDPGYGGKTVLNNQTSYSLELKYNSGRIDTSININPFSIVDIYHFGGLGKGRDYHCCPCEFNKISITVKDSFKTITKLITDKNNWLLINDNKKKYSGKEIICTFLLEQNDIQ